MPHHGADGGGPPGLTHRISDAPRAVEKGAAFVIPDDDPDVTVVATTAVFWADACDRVAALDDPHRWMAIGADQRAAVLSVLPLPVLDPVHRGLWTADWIGLGPVLDRIVESDDPATVARIANAAAIMRAWRGIPGRA